MWRMQGIRGESTVSAYFGAILLKAVAGAGTSVGT